MTRKAKKATISCISNHSPLTQDTTIQTGSPLKKSFIPDQEKILTDLKGGSTSVRCHYGCRSAYDRIGNFHGG